MPAGGGLSAGAARGVVRGGNATLWVKGAAVTNDPTEGPTAVGNANPSTDPDPTEAELVDRLRAGDEDAFAWLVERHHAGMVRLALVHVRSRAVAEEVAQEAWIGLLRGLDKFEARSSLRTWLYRIAVNRAISTGLRERAHLPVDDRELDDDDGSFTSDGWWVTPPVHWADEAVDRIAARDVADRIRALIADLPLAQRQVVTLRDVEGLPSAEVCKILGITEGNQRVQLHRARSRLRRLLEEQIVP